MLHDHGKRYRRTNKHRCFFCKRPGFFIEGWEVAEDFILIQTDIVRSIKKLVVANSMTLHFTYFPALDRFAVSENGHEIFYTLKEAQVLIEEWRLEYNTFRPHSSLKYRPPAPEAWLH